MKARTWLAYGLMSVVPTGLLAAGLYSYTDKDGRIHYTDRPPASANARAVAALPPLTSRAAAAATPDRPRRPAVVLYGTQSCGYCRQARAYLHRRGIGFSDLDIETNPIAYAAYSRLNGRGVPVILVGDRRLDGYSEANLARLLADAGY